MPSYRASLQTLGATVLLVMALACRGSNSSSNPSAAAKNASSITGTITFDRVPLNIDASGMPTGLVDASVPANLKNLPARGVIVRAYQQVEQTQPDGTKVHIWALVGATLTSTEGKYEIGAWNDRSTMVEVLSTFNVGQLLRVIAEPQGINSPTPAPDRLQYAMRKAADGSAPANNNTPSSVLTTNAVVNFTIGLNDAWWVVNPAYNLSSNAAPLVTQAVLETDFPGRTPGLGSGSRILGIGDSAFSIANAYGSATPGANLDLHYWPGRSEPRGTYIEYDRYIYPQAFDANSNNYNFFGSVQGGSANDDAWDEGVLFPLLARGFLYAENSNRTFSVPLNPLLPPSFALGDLCPDVARTEGLAEAMAANLLKSPYLADTQGTILAAPVLDIRDISSLPSSQLTPYSAPALRAFAWEVILKANSLSPSPATPTDWAKIDPATTVRFFKAPASTDGNTGITAHDIEPLNIFSQISRLKEAKSASETVDLAAIFTDPVLNALGAPFGITWPRPTSGVYASFVTDWGTDPSGAFPPLTLSMVKAVPVQGAYPNVSQGEVFYAGFNLNADKRCVLRADIVPALAAGSTVEVDLPRIGRSFAFIGAGGSTEPIVISMNTTAPVYYAVRVRLTNSSSIQPDITVTLSLLPAP